MLLHRVGVKVPVKTQEPVGFNLFIPDIHDPPVLGSELPTTSQKGLGGLGYVDLHPLTHSFHHVGHVDCFTHDTKN